MKTETQEVNFNDDIAILPLAKWLDYAAGCDDSIFVALPLIQRGSVWKPKQIIDLWDTLLRGMPLGSLMFSPMPEGIEVRKIGKKEMVKTPKHGAIGLIDGQQRTLAMLIAWKVGDEMDRRIWVDFADKPSDEHLFRLHVTTKNQPFGFQKASPSTKLFLSDRRNALNAHSIEKQTQDELFKSAKPYDSKFPLDLRVLLELWITHDEASSKWVEQVNGIFLQNDGNGFSSTELDLIKLRIEKFAVVLQRLFKLKVPLLKVNSGFFNGDAVQLDFNDETSDPPLAVLFKRIGTGGTPLSDADYAYSVIKHHIPKTYKLVEDLHEQPNIARLLSATDLVMSAVRLAAVEYEPLDKKPIVDRESPTKQEFHRLVKQEGFLHKQFLPLIEQGTLKDAFGALSVLLEYQPEDNKLGLPAHAFPLLNRPLVQVLLRWIRCVQRDNSKSDLIPVLKQNREEVLRFVMYWQLCVFDPKKASLVAYKKLQNNVTAFPSEEIYKAMLEDRVAIPIVAPETIKQKKLDVIFSSDLRKLRGWNRFDTQNTTDDVKQIVSLYQRWWGNGHRYEHPLLLWLQRETVAGFEGSPVAGREEDTPYDYDHICPANHWSNWTGEAYKPDCIMQFLTESKNGGHWLLGNSIGNVRVWDSSKNRSDGKDAPSIKLEFDNQSERDKLLKQSAIDPLQIEDWSKCSVGERSWNEDRVQAFQQVVEKRAFNLYQSFYNDLGFSAWPVPELTE